MEGMTSFPISSPTTDRWRRAHERSAALGLAAICLGFLMITLDATIVNVALGPIIANLGGRLSAAQWIANGYTIAFASLLLTAGALADRVGARAGFVIGLDVLAFGSALCTVATSLPMLIAARVLQGLGAAWLMPCSLALIAHTFPDAHARRRALAIWGGASWPTCCSSAVSSARSHSPRSSGLSIDRWSIRPCSGRRPSQSRWRSGSSSTSASTAASSASRSISTKPTGWPR
jgi:MFS family permease